MSRQIKDIKDKNTGQLVYPRTHIKAVVIDGSTSLEEIINTKQDSIIKLSNINASIWTEDHTYEDFPYRCDIACEGVTDDMYAEVVFNLEQSTSGNYAPVCETGNGIVTIWSAIDDTISIPVIVITK